MFEIKHLLSIVDAYRAATGVEDKTVSSRVFNDGKKIDALRAGGDLTTERYNAAVWWFSTNWPVGAEWPEGISRPVVEVTTE
ncbi:hypothetical protein C8D77_101254 [Mesorhizobium loti]|uniref:Uncharacterized protein n=1 Tax=Rhizobium loti TaxID=381 RepID=A0A8E3B6V5_RHILI|nr:hypothetical protein [Mesorhizobium loti]PWJ93575.1 hypothetical protein C8D77_101254 [Mesorhizobium loti]